MNRGAFYPNHVASAYRYSLSHADVKVIKERGKDFREENKTVINDDNGNSSFNFFLNIMAALVKVYGTQEPLLLYFYFMCLC